LNKLRAVRVDEVHGLKTMVAKTKDSVASSVGLTNREINAFLAFYSTGVPVSNFRFEREPLVVRVRAQENLSLSQEELKQAVALRGRDRDFTLGDIVEFEKVDSVSVIRRKNSETYLRALADLDQGSTFSEVSGDLDRIVQGFSLEKGERFELGGDAEGAGDANTSILKVVPLAMSLLILFLLLEFKSYRKVLIANLALPVTILGVFPGLWLAGAPFGFMSLLGLLALVGISVNNIILLLEALEETGSLEKAIKSRIRAIFLTTTLTLAGLIPLALEDSSLWPPLAWTMISGLITGTVATLIVVPALYRLFFGASLKKSIPIILPAFLLLSFLRMPAADAQGKIGLKDILQRAGQTQEALSLEAALEGEKSKESAQWRETWLPKASIAAEAFERNDDLMTNSSFGPLKAEDKSRLDVKVEIEQKIFYPSEMLGGRKAALKNLEAQKLTTGNLKTETKIKYALMVMSHKEIEIQNGFLNLQISNLKQRLVDMAGLVARGRVSRADLLRVQVLKERAEQQLEKVLIDQKQLSAFLNSENVLRIGEKFELPLMSELNLNLTRSESQQVKALAAQSEALLQESKRWLR